MENKGIIKAVTVIAKIIEVFCWIGSGLSAAIVAVTLIGRQDLYHFLMTADNSATAINIPGFEIASANAAALAPGAFAIAFLTATITFILMAMIARNVNLIFKTAAGETWFSKGSTPFQPDNIRMVREIGIFAISIPLIGVVMQAVAAIVLGLTAVEISVDFTGIFFGLVALALTQFFSYGQALEGEIDGLV